MRASIVVLLLSLLASGGCSPAVELKGEPAVVRGKLTNSGGQPVGGVLLTLQPLEDGHLAPLEVAADGTFQGELVPGTYAYSLGKSSKARNSAQSLKQVDAKFLEPDLNRTVTVTPGSELAIALE